MNKEYLIYKLSDEVKNSCKIEYALFLKFGVKRELRKAVVCGVLVGFFFFVLFHIFCGLLGLRNDDGSGVLVGLTNIGNVVGYERAEDGHLEPTEG